MKPAEFDRSSIVITSNDETIALNANGSVMKFDGFLKIYSAPDDDDTKNILPVVKIGDEVNIEEIIDEQHFTNPPPRYSEASLVKKLEEYKRPLLMQV